MEHEDASEHRRLRDAAFGRNSTRADVEALAEFERRRVDPAPVVDAETSTAPVSEAAEVVAASAADSALPRRSALRPVLVAAGLVTAAGLGAVVGAHLATRPEPSLAVFADPESSVQSTLFSTPGVDMLSSPGTVSVFDYRLISESDGERYFAAIGVQNTGTSAEEPIFSAVVCFGVEIADGSGSGGCRDISEFQRIGITVSAPGDDALAPTYRWGPDGGVQLLDRSAPGFTG